MSAFARGNPVSRIDSRGLEDGEIIVVTLPAEYDSSGARTTPQVVEASEANEEQTNRTVREAAVKQGWVLVDVPNLTEGNRRLRALRCRCIKALHITGHGTLGIGGRQAVVSTQDPNWKKPGYGRLTATIGANGEVTTSGVQEFFSRMLAGGKFCSPCTITLRGCNVGMGEEGKGLLQAIADWTKCRVGAYSIETKPGKDGGLPGNKATRGADPDVWREPR